MNSDNLETRNRRKPRKSITFTTARERKRLDSRHQSKIDPNSSNQTSSLTGKRNQSSSQPAVSEFQASRKDKENSLGKRSTKSTGQRSNSSLKTAKTGKINENSMKAAKTRKKDSDKVILYFIIVTCNQVEYASTVYIQYFAMNVHVTVHMRYGCVKWVCNVTLKYRKLSEELKDCLGLVSI